MKLNYLNTFSMSLNNVNAGKNTPHEFNVIIEIPMNADPIKYEVDKETAAIFVDRFMSTAMHYPTNYGYVPKTISGDGDPSRAAFERFEFDETGRDRVLSTLTVTR